MAILSPLEAVTEHFSIRLEEHYVSVDPIWVIYNSSCVCRGFEVAGRYDRDSAVRECLYLEKLNYA